jgi:hypothetical protein
MFGNRFKGAPINPNPSRIAKMRVAGEKNRHGLCFEGTGRRRYSDSFLVTSNPSFRSN